MMIRDFIVVDSEEYVYRTMAWLMAVELKKRLTIQEEESAGEPLGLWSDCEPRAVVMPDQPKETLFIRACHVTGILGAIAGAGLAMYGLLKGLEVVGRIGMEWVTTCHPTLSSILENYVK